MNIDGKGFQDLAVDFADRNSGYNLEKGSRKAVRFLMKNAGGCFLPFSAMKKAELSAWMERKASVCWIETQEPWVVELATVNSSRCLWHYSFKHRRL